MHTSSSQIVVIGAGVGGLTTAALLAQAGYPATVLEAGTYPGGCAGTFYHKGYRFEAGATLAGGFQPGGPHAVVGEQLGITWPVRPADPAWVVHLPDREIRLTQDKADMLRQFPASARFWEDQARIADVSWSLAAQGLPWPPTSVTELGHLARLGMAHLPQAGRLLPLVYRTARQWLAAYGLAGDEALLRFVDAQLLISAQTTAQHANALYSATALDLPRQGVQHVEGGIGGLAQALADAVERFGGRVLYKHRVTKIDVRAGRVVGVHTLHGRQPGPYVSADFVIANLTPGSLDELLAENSPARLQREVTRRGDMGWGAFVLYLGVDSSKLPVDLPDHHQIVTDMHGPLGEGRSIFVSFSPAWDASRAPEGHRAVTVTTHTAVQPWWELLERDPAAYATRKQTYTEQMLDGIERAIPGFRASVALVMDGTPVTYSTWTHRYRGMVGGFPQVSLLRARGPRTGIPNLRLVGDSIFPGQSTAGVTAGAMRVSRDVLRALPEPAADCVCQPQMAG
jgi:C-3',4' desaturase CrtD